MTSNGYDYDSMCRKIYLELPHTYKIFLKNINYDKNYIFLNKRQLLLACTNATSDIARSANYHSSTGPSNWKVAGFFGKWVAHHRPIQSNGCYPLNLTNSKIIEVNSYFSAFIVQSLIKKDIYPKLFDDLKYCFEFRTMSGDSVALLLQHALEYSPKGYKAL
ncbi:MAG: hypothetical protein V3U92_10885 [Cellulophaga sp.]